MVCSLLESSTLQVNQQADDDPATNEMEHINRESLLEPDFVKLRSAPTNEWHTNNITQYPIYKKT